VALIIPHDCPFCETQKVAFLARFDWSIPGEDSEKLFLAICSACVKGVIFQIRFTKHSASYDFSKAFGDLQSNGMYLIVSWPNNIVDNIPEDVPENVESLYRQARLCFRQQAWDAAGMTLRKALDVSTKGLDPSLSGKSLAARIDALHKNGSLTSEIRDWAHEIRLDGNEAAHEEDPTTPEQVASLIEFSNAYLRYVYTLPALVKRNRKRRVDA
jgi:hypothetical protein